jgi:hypothetical protein
MRSVAGIGRFFRLLPPRFWLLRHKTLKFQLSSGANARIRFEKRVLSRSAAARTLLFSRRPFHWHGICS